MGVLVLFLFFAFVPEVQAGPPARLLEVLYDQDNPQNSIAILDDCNLQIGEYYAGYRVINFEPEAVVVKEEAAHETIKWLKEGEAEPAARREARKLFVVRQLRAVHDAQMRHLAAYGSFSASLDDLAAKGYLNVNLGYWIKHDYRFEVIAAGFKRGRPPEYAVNDPYYYAIAAPEQAGEDFFIVDSLGDVRFSSSRFALESAPVWHYAGEKRPRSWAVGATDED